MAGANVAIVMGKPIVVVRMLGRQRFFDLGRSPVCRPGRIVQCVSVASVKTVIRRLRPCIESKFFQDRFHINDDDSAHARKHDQHQYQDAIEDTEASSLC